MIVIDEYLAIRTLLHGAPDELPVAPMALPTLAHWRLLQRIHAPATGRLPRALAGLSEAGREVLRHPSPTLLTVLDLRPSLDHAARIAASHGGAGLLVAETLTAAIEHGRGELWFGHERNVGRKLGDLAAELGIAIHVVG